MGYNSLVLFMNDAAHNITEDPEFPRKLQLAIYHGMDSERWKNDIPIGNHGNAAALVWQAHADLTGIVAVGGNCASILAQTPKQAHHREEDQIQLAKVLADTLGYKLVKKSAKELKNGRKFY